MSLSGITLILLVIFLGLSCFKTFIPDRVIEVLCGITAGVLAVLLLVKG